VDDFGVWNRAFARPIRQGSSVAVARLRVLTKAVTLRRMKSLLASKLPTKQVELQVIDVADRPEFASFNETYRTLVESARIALRAALAAGTVMKHYANILETLLRLRQTCCAPTLVPEKRLEAARQVLSDFGIGGLSSAPKLDAEAATKLFAKLKDVTGDISMGQESAAEECAVCLCEPETPADVRILRGCGHCFCHDCIQHVLDAPTLHGVRCPLCRAPFGRGDILDGKALKHAVEAAAAPEIEQVADEKPPPKVQALLEALQATAGTADAKAVVFSYFSKFLSVLEPFLEKAGITFARIDGSKSHVRTLRLHCHGRLGSHASLMFLVVVS